MGSGSN